MYKWTRSKFSWTSWTLCCKVVSWMIQGPRQTLWRCANPLWFITFHFLFGRCGYQAWFFSFQFSYAFIVITRYRCSFICKRIILRCEAYQRLEDWSFSDHASGIYRLVQVNFQVKGWLWSNDTGKAVVGSLCKSSVDTRSIKDAYTLSFKLQVLTLLRTDIFVYA